MFPAIYRVKHRALTADGTHGAVGLHVFHCDLPGLHVHELITPLIASESLRLYIRTNLSLVSERDEWTETSCAALFKAHSLARLLLGGELHRTMQLTKTYIEAKIEVGCAREGRSVLLQQPIAVAVLSTQSAPGITTPSERLPSVGDPLVPN
jgi:hypothetical protein